MADKLSKLSLLARFDDMSRFQNSISLNEKRLYNLNFFFHFFGNFYLNFNFSFQ